MICRWLPFAGAWILISILIFCPTASFADKRILANPATKPSIGVADRSKLTLSASPGLPQGTVGRPYRYQIKTNAANIRPTYRIIAGRLPTGLKVDTRGLIQGIPGTPGRFKFTIQATMKGTSAANQVTQQLTLNIQPRALKLSVKSRPEALTITSAGANAHTLTYHFSSGESGLKLFSSEGRFMVAKKQLAKVTRPMAITLKQSSGQAVESLTVSPEIIKAAQKLKASQIAYVREFKAQDQTVRARTAVRITMALTPALHIQNLSLHFKTKALSTRIQKKGSTQTTITVNQTPPPLYAQVLLSRPGVFRAYWQIDGKALTKPIAYKAKDKQMVVAYPNKRVPLNNLTPGNHRIQFVITTPKMTTPGPQAVLVVEKGTLLKKLAPIKLQAPDPDSNLNYKAFSFKWIGPKETAAYRIEFSSAENPEAFFSADLKESAFHLNNDTLKRHFIPGKAYVWKVKGLNTQKKMVSQSLASPFVFKPQPAFMAGQIVVVTESTSGGRITLNRLSKKYKLKAIESTAIRTLKRTATVYSISGDVSAMVQQISREHGVLQVQPNHLFRTMAEPKNDLQQIITTLNLPAVHQHYQGKGITVAIVDTGVDTHHPDLKQRVVRHANLIRNNPYRAEIHGTALAGVMAASINNYGITGIAPQAELMALRACWQTSQDDPEGTCTTLSISKAIDMAIESNAQIVNMSFGAPAPDRLMMQLLGAGAKKGVLFVAPVGNTKARKKMPFPASHSKVLSVGGWDSAHTPYPNADLAKAADVCAPAGNIFTTTPGKGHNFLSGTSISAAIVTGILAVAKEKNRFLNMQTLPPFENDICRWQEKLINRSVCNP